MTNDNLKEKREEKKISELIVLNVPSFTDDNTFIASGKLLTKMTNTRGICITSRLMASFNSGKSPKFHA